MLIQSVVAHNQARPAAPIRIGDEKKPTPARKKPTDPPKTCPLKTATIEIAIVSGTKIGEGPRIAKKPHPIATKPSLLSLLLFFFKLSFSKVQTTFLKKILLLIEK